MVAAKISVSRLDRETREFHDEADRWWRRLVDGEVSRDAYAHQLTIAYGFEAPLEGACAFTPGLPSIIDLRGRFRSGLLAQDLLALRFTPSSIPRLAHYWLEPFQDAAGALGWMYVVERSAPVHLEVRDELIERRPDLKGACTYLAAFEGALTQRRSDLDRAINQLCSSADVCDRIIEAARAASRALVQWQRAHAWLRRAPLA